ncbi:MAG: hypothetical protein RAK22_01360, partial [Nanoarchaeota archaeon]|nr:hypothetical protein [Nanoarchaeota archaeon]
TSSIPAISINAMLRNIGLPKYRIIDTITNSLYNGSKDDTENAIFVDSPADLTRLSMSIDNVLKENKDVFVFIDSITAFLIYNPEDEILRFIHYTSSVVRENNHKVFFVVLSNAGISSAFIDKIRSFIDYEMRL